MSEIAPPARPLPETVPKQPEASFELDFSDEPFPREINEFVNPKLRVSAEQEAAFAAHIAYVDEKGDAGNIPTLRKFEGRNRLRARGRWTYSAIAAIEMSAVMADVSKPVVTIAGASLGAVACLGHSLYYHAKELPHARRALNKPSQELLGERYEIYKKPATRKKPPQLLLRYYGPLEKETASDEEIKTTGRQVAPLDRVQRMALLAEKYGVDGIVLSESMLKGTVGQEQADKLLGSKPLQIHEVVGVHTGKTVGLEKVAIHSPQFWLEQKNEAREIDISDNVTAATEVLRTLNPDDKTVHVFDYFKGDDRQNHYVQQAAQQFAASELSFDSQLLINKLDMPDGASLKDLQRNWEARFSGNSIVWESHGVTQKEALEKYLYLTPKAMLEILRTPESDTKKARILAQAVAAGAVIKGFGALAAEVANEETVVKDENRPLFDKVLTRDEKGRWAQADGIYRRGQMHAMAVPSIIGSGASLVAGLYLVGISGSYLEQSAKAEMSDITAQFKDQQLDFTDLDVRNQLLADDPAAGVWTVYKNGLNSLDFSRHDLKMPEGLPGRDSEVIDKSRYEQTDNSPRGEWDITPHGTSGTAGYWSLSTSSKLNLDSFAWQPINDLDPTMPAKELPTSYTLQDSGITVGRYINTPDLIPGTGLIRIPVRAGTVPVAANLDGRPVRLNYIAGGTYALEVNGSINNARLTYWLKEDVLNAHSPQAVHNVEATFQGKQVKPDGVDDVWAGLIPGYKDMNPAYRRQAVRNYTKQNFDYRIHNHYRMFVPNDKILAGITEMITDEKTAQCSYASSMQAIATMPSNQPFAVAGGFLVSESDTTQLSSHGYHAWGVAYDNEDGTPGKNILPEDEAWLKQKPKPNQASTSVTMTTQQTAASSQQDYRNNPFIQRQKPQPERPPLWPFGAVPASLMLGGTALLRRRELAERHRALMAAYDKRWLERNPDAVRLAGEVAGAMQWDPERDILGAIDRVRQHNYGEKPTAIDVTDVVAKLLKPEIHGSHMAAHIADAIGETPHAGYTAAIKQVDKTLRRARRVYERPRPQKKRVEQRDSETGQLQL